MSESESQANLLQGTSFYHFYFCKVRGNANPVPNTCSGRCKTNIFTTERSNISRNRLSPVSGVSKEEVFIQCLQLELSYNFTCSHFIFSQKHHHTHSPSPVPCTCVCFRTIKVKKGTWLSACSTTTQHYRPEGPRCRFLLSALPHAGHTNQHK